LNAAVRRSIWLVGVPDFRADFYFPIRKCASPHCLAPSNSSRSGNIACIVASPNPSFPEREISKAMTSIQSPQQLGDALRAARRQLGLTQPQLALAAGVGVRFIVDLEAGKPTLRLENVLRVIDALGGEIQLLGLPSAPADVRSEGRAHGA
jgi:HTH-type transcriptional regulator / antitoxin HipB